MREAHAHILQLGRSMSMLDLSTCASAEDAIDRVASAHAANPSAAWILAHSARPESWSTPRWPTRQELDRASDNRPVLAWCFDYHALVCSSAALDAVRITKDTRIENGAVELDEHGDPTGLLLEHAALHAWDRVPEPTESERRSLVREACAHLASLGYTEVHDLKAQRWLGSVLSDLIRAGEIDQRFTLFPLMPDLDHAVAHRNTWDDRVTLGGGKIFTDGTLNSRTAWVLHPWDDAPDERPNGTPMMTPAQIQSAVEHAASHQVPIAAHAIGDAAVRAVLDAIEAVPSAPRGARVEHAELIDQRDIPRFAELDVVASVQPCHLLADIEALNRACSSRLDRVLPLRELIDSGLEPGRSLIFGSDAPIVRADHEDSVIAATMRRRPEMDESDAIGLNQQLTHDEAMRCFTASGS